MFRQSTPLLGSMPTISKFIIHPPLPLNPRESKQLLNLLTASFRQQLDIAHGVPLQSFNINPKSVSSSKKSQHPKDKAHLRTPTDLHLNSILTNPLFNHGSSIRSPTSSSADPMDIFELAVSKGMMTTHWAKLCLAAKRKDIVQSPVLSVQQGMKESGAGRTVLKWLGASGMTNDNQFMTNWGFTEILMEFIVAEELQEVAWKWIKRSFEPLPLYSTTPSPLRKHFRANLSRPLFLLVKAEAAGAESLDSAYLCISRAAGYLKGKTQAEMKMALGSAGIFLSYTSTGAARPDHQPPSESAFDSFLGLVPVISNHTKYHFAHLNLHHPCRPSADLALSYLFKMDSIPATELPGSTHFQETSMKHLIHLGLDTAKFLFEKDQVEEAEWVMAYLQRNFPDRLGFQEQTRLQHAKAEASSLQLLESLSLA